MRILSQLYPLMSFRSVMKRDIFFGVFLTIFLLVFTPFGLSSFAYDRFYIIVGYGVTSYCMIALNDLAAYKLFPSTFHESTWTVGKQITWAFWHLLWLGGANLIYGVWVGAFPLTFYSFIKIVLYALASAIIQVMGITLLRQNYLLKQHQNHAAAINQDIKNNKDQQEKIEIASPILKFIAENNKDYFEITPASLISISSQDNYVEFIFQKEKKIHKELLRSTLSRVEDILVGQQYFLRCHRAFIVNLNRIKSVEGNSQGYRINMEGHNQPIPVARPKNKALKERIHSLALQ